MVVVSCAVAFSEVAANWAAVDGFAFHDPFDPPRIACSEQSLLVFC
jgi:hypothetical protein